MLQWPPILVKVQSHQRMQVTKQGSGTFVSAMSNCFLRSWWKDGLNRWFSTATTRVRFPPHWAFFS
ncbi:hypothetical protein LAZ67_11002985 [Cordylochernes scorpioides]|uniref:Uncharacterized protein n=1 Tax=Cordylochernes scorpioides TaxID=51811 RepID=A0ABY6L0B8_9ARAC|nr:hypothetical protein LAZ67_11002985 [Cordylochernes scorpioides]